MEQTLGFDPNQFLSLATPPAESSVVATSTAMGYDAETQPNEKPDHSNDDKKEVGHQTEGTGRNHEELSMEQSDDDEESLVRIHYHKI